jgi:hypothetical protein
MSVGANTYAEHEDVERLIGDIVDSRTFTTGTVPSLAQVEAELDNVAADLNRELDQVGYTVPVNQADYETAYNFMKAANAYGAAAVILATVPSQTYEPVEDTEAPPVDRITMYSRKYQHALKVIRENRLRAGRHKQRMADLFAGSQEDDEGNEKYSIFSRGMDDYPGRRSLVAGSDNDD